MNDVWFGFFVLAVRYHGLFNTKAILVEDNRGKEVHAFPKGFSPKVNVIPRLQFELTMWESNMLAITPPWLLLFFLLRLNIFVLRILSILTTHHWFLLQLPPVFPFLFNTSPTHSFSDSLSIYLSLSICLSVSLSQFFLIWNFLTKNFHFHIFLPSFFLCLHSSPSFNYDISF